MLASETIQKLVIGSPKRDKRLQRGWEGFFPYYAGYPEAFAQALLKSAGLRSNATVLDPWNGSGTTVAAANSLGLRSLGYDLNPVMVVVARARMLPVSEADALRPLAASIVQNLRLPIGAIASDDPLQQWFSIEAATIIRGIEAGLRATLIGELTVHESGVTLDRLSGIAATLYVALFNTCRALTASFRASNPTWMRVPKAPSDRLNPTKIQIVKYFNEAVRDMASSLAGRKETAQSYEPEDHCSKWNIGIADATTLSIEDGSVDFVLTSPPYCTRIDYTSATRIELSVIQPLLDFNVRELTRQMTGSTLSPRHEIAPSVQWGQTCLQFVDDVFSHPSKASSTYYYRTHLDYFDKMSRSIKNVARVLSDGAACIMVVQDSHYKDIHNDVPRILVEMAEGCGLELVRKEDFVSVRSMSRINPGVKKYTRQSTETESVLCLQKKG